MVCEPLYSVTKKLSSRVEIPMGAAFGTPEADCVVAITSDIPSHSPASFKSIFLRYNLEQPQDYTDLRMSTCGIQKVNVLLEI